MVGRSVDSKMMEMLELACSVLSLASSASVDGALTLTLVKMKVLKGL
jgi:hypothetical protein